MKPFDYLNGMVPADDAPVMDNPARIYCPQCRLQDKQHCGDPGMCGNMRPMKPLPEQVDVPAPRIAHTPRPGSKELSAIKAPKLDDSAPQQTPKKVKTPAEIGQRFPERLMGRRTTFTQLKDGEEHDYEWFMENITKTVEQFK